MANPAAIQIASRHHFVRAPVTFCKLPRKPNEEEETKLGKRVTPEKHPRTGGRRKLPGNASGPPPNRQPRTRRRKEETERGANQRQFSLNVSLQGHPRIQARRRKEILRSESGVTPESERGGGRIFVPIWGAGVTPPRGSSPISLQQQP